MKKITAVLMIIAMLLSIAAVGVSAQVAEDQDPTPANIGVLYSSDATGISVSYVRQFVDGNGTPFLAGGGVGAHGGHETRIVRTDDGTYAAYITNATGAPDDEHPGWYNGVATFDVIKITATGFESIYQGVYPQAAGSCTPNILYDGKHTVYVTIIADGKDRYASTMGTPEFTNGIWLEVIEIDTNTDEVSYHAGPEFYDHTTTPFEDHGYGYSQPCLDVEHGRMFMITNGGEAEDPDYTGYGNQAGYMAWWVYDLNTHTWDPTPRTIKFFSRRCYMNVYPDGNGGFTMITERCAPTAELGKALGCTFTTNGYLWDALYLVHIADPLNDCYVGQKPADASGNSTVYEWVHERDTVIWEPNYASGAKNFIASAAHYGTAGCTYLDDQNRIHVIYSLTYYTTPTSKTTKMSAVYHAMYTLSGEVLYNELIPSSLLTGNPGKSFKGPSGFAMTQGPDGVYYVFLLINKTKESTTLEIWSSPQGDGVNFTKKAAGIVLKDPGGNEITGGTKPIIANTRNGSVLDGVIPIMFHTSGSGGDPYYCFSVKVPGEYHRHVYTAVVTEPTCTEGGYTTYTCSCGDSYTDDETGPLGNDFGDWTEATAPTCTEPGVERRDCSRCDAFETQPVDPLGHDYTETVTAPTCTEQGFTTHVCSRCGDTYKDGYVPAAGHNWGEWTEVTPATEEEEGLERRVCLTDPSHFEERAIPVKEHVHVMEEIPAVGATCTADGVKAHFRCTGCGRLFADIEGSEQIESEDTVIPAPGHDYTDTVTAPTCTEKGFTTHVCTRCGDSYVDTETDALGHDFGADGKAEKCSRCGEKNPDYVPPASFTDVPADAYFKEPVDWAVANGITTGTDKTHFSPDDPCTRAQAVTFLWRAAGQPEPKAANNPFRDVKSGEYYYKAVLWAVE
ncbi:MAG: S-layer homology domain-containing protein, partial [Clostridia bacterium]|nr:S-layer homology domain-containing protein [Clostridia bacterium]